MAVYFRGDDVPSSRLLHADLLLSDRVSKDRAYTDLSTLASFPLLFVSSFHQIQRCISFGVYRIDAVEIAPDDIRSVCNR
jgi:hypothetical protein